MRADDERATPSPERRRRYRRGHLGEQLALVALSAKGYRIIGRRVRTPAGEIDLIAVRGNRLMFCEVKRRNDRAAAEASIGTRQRDRIRRAADLWLARNACYRDHEMGFDVVFVLPWRWPQHIENAL